MALRGVKPTAVQKRLKVLFYGPAGVGKTTAAIQFPKPYLIDTERGSENDQYVKTLDNKGGVVFYTTDFDEILEEVTSLLREKHDYCTLIIDPLTTVYNDLCQKWADRLAKQSRDPASDGTEFQRHRDKADKQVQHLFKLLLRLDMNVIITSHSKVKWEKIGGDFKEAGNTFDCYKKLDYLFDLVLEVQKRAGERIAMIKKTRIQQFPEGECIPFSYDEIANRYGKELLEKQAQVQVLASKEQIEELNRLIELLQVSEEIYQKWLDKCNSQTFKEMPEDCIIKCIQMLRNKINNKEAA